MAGLSPLFRMSLRPLEVRRVTIFVYIRIFYTVYSFSLSDFVLYCKLVLQNVPDDVRVPPTGNLPPASFRFHLTMDTLALS